MSHPAPEIDPALVTTATKLPSTRQNVPRSAAAFLAIIAGLVVIKAVLARAASASFKTPAQAAVFQWWFIASLAVVGLAGVWFAARTGFPETWDPRVPLRDRLLVPMLLGIGFGTIAIAVDAGTGWTAIAARQMHLTSIHIPFPMSLLIYPGGAAIVNIIYYLVPMPLVLWLAGFALGGRVGPRTFWAVGVLAAAIEPLTQDLGMPGQRGIMLAVFAEDFALNLAQVTVFRRAGFGASVVLRVTFYLAWHMLPSALGR